ncbi:hypothetical protein [Hyphomicrobium sp.]|uniref:hypothetical protein n=1 Tax=Hyphomicrobium sp. TaxID=82 RepID=UPI003F7221B2
MRGPSIGVAILSVLVCAGGAAPALSADEASSASAAPQADYYTRRAESVIQAEKKNAAKAHPLAAAHPGFEVVICEAGCPVGQTPEIVFARREAEQPKAATQGEMIPTSSEANPNPADAAESNLACIAGCYDKTAAAETREEAPSPWTASVVPAAAAPDKHAPAAPLRDKLSPIR